MRQVKTMKVKPLPNMKVRRPAHEGGQLMHEDGEVVPLNTYWRRRLLAKDVVPVTPEDEASTKAKREAAAKVAEAPENKEPTTPQPVKRAKAVEEK